MARHHYSDRRFLRIAACSMILGSLLLTPAAGSNLEFEISEGPSEDMEGTSWPRYSFDLSNTNHNPAEWQISPVTVPHLVRAWQTFNDNALVPTLPPTGFLLEAAVGLQFRSSVVGVISLPVIRDGIIYYVDQLGTMFARDARTGRSLNANRHWTTTLVDPDFDSGSPAVAPDLFYTAVNITRDHVWILSSLYGRLHAVERDGGAEIDFDPSTPEIDPLAIAPDRDFASSLGEPVIFETPGEHGLRTLFVAGINVILNDALVQGREAGMIVALDITNAHQPFEVWRTHTIDINPATGLRYGTGVSAGSGLAVDLKRRLLYGGTGQNTTEPYPGYPDPASAPPGYIDRGDSLFAVDYGTGRFVWVNQFHHNDVFDLNNPVPTGPGRTDGPRDADVLVPPVLFRAKTAVGTRDLVAAGSKGGLFRAVDRDSGQTIWERQVSKPSGLGGVQSGAAFANGFVYVAAFEGLDDGWSDANFNAPGSTYLNAFFATFAPAFWADAEDVRPDADPATGARTKVYKLEAGTGRSVWSFPDGRDYVDLPAGVCMRHVSVANDVLYVGTSSGTLSALDTRTGSILFQDQTVDLNAHFGLGLGKPHHAAMNAGVLISGGMVYVPYGGQNEPSGGIIAYELAKKK